MVMFKDVLDRISECADPMCRKAAKPVRGEMLSYFDCRKFGTMTKETGDDLSEDLAVFYKKNIAKSATADDLKKVKAIYSALFTDPVKGLKTYGRFVPPLAKVKASDLTRSLGSKDTVGGGMLPVLSMLNPIWKVDDENKHLLARILFIILSKRYETSLDRFHKLAQYTGAEGSMFSDVGDAVKKMNEFSNKLDNEPQIFKLK